MAQTKKAKSASQILRDGRAVRRAVAGSRTRPAATTLPAATRKRRAA